jgi:hypothetical protein
VTICIPTALVTKIAAVVDYFLFKVQILRFFSCLHDRACVNNYFAQFFFHHFQPGQRQPLSCQLYLSLHAERKSGHFLGVSTWFIGLPWERVPLFLIMQHGQNHEILPSNSLIKMLMRIRYIAQLMCYISNRTVSYWLRQRYDMANYLQTLSWRLSLKILTSVIQTPLPFLLS